MTPAGTFLGGGTPLLLYISTISTFHSIHSHCPQETGEAAAAVGNVVDNYGSNFAKIWSTRATAVTLHR